MCLTPAVLISRDEASSHSHSSYYGMVTGVVNPRRTEQVVEVSVDTSKVSRGDSSPVWMIFIFLGGEGGGGGCNSGLQGNKAVNLSNIFFNLCFSVLLSVGSACVGASINITCLINAIILNECVNLRANFDLFMLEFFLKMHLWPETA